MLRNSLNGQCLATIGAFALFVTAASCTVKTTTDANDNLGGSTSGGSGGSVLDTAGNSGSTPVNNGGAAAEGGEMEPSLGGEAGASIGGEAGEAGSSGEAGASPMGSGCIDSISGLYVVRKDGIAIKEGPPEKVVVDGASGTKNTPLADVIAVAEESYAACALVKGGQVQCWQEDANHGNQYGQLGDGDTTAISVFRSSVVLTAANKPLEKVVSLAASINANSACAVTSDGKLWCWGDLGWIASNGALSSPFAQAITLDGQSELTGVIQATVGSNHACALIKGSPNKVLCWGTAAAEELGQGNTTNQQYPVAVPGLENPTKVLLTYANNNYGCIGCGAWEEGVCAIDGGTVQCWGANSNGALGSSSGVGVVPAPTPVITSTMATLRDVVDMQEGTQGFAVLRKDQTIWRWGLPDGSTPSAASYGVPNVSQIAWPGNNSTPIRYLTSDGVYHSGMTEVTVNCGQFE